MKKEGKTINFEGKTYYNARDTCKLLGISYPLLRQFIIDKKVPYIFFGRRRYFNPDELSNITESKVVVRKEVES